MSPDPIPLRDDDIGDGSAAPSPNPSRSDRARRITGILIIVLVVLAAAAYFSARRYAHNAMRDALPQIDGTIALPGAAAPLFGLAAPVTVERDAHGVPHIHASSMDDLIYAQGYITAQDRLGPKYLDHDRLQRTLQIRTAADRALPALPPDQRHWLEVYARGVNASIADQHDRMPIEFRILQYKSVAPWSPRDCLLVELAMYQDLTTGFPVKLNREALAAHFPPDAIADLYPVGNWRDHPPGQAAPDLTAPQPEFLDIPLDESQSRLRTPDKPPERRRAVPAQDLAALQRTLALFRPCATCVAGSNGWAVSGARSASGKPILSNDMHLSLGVPTLWYEADLDAQNPAPLSPFHVAGVTLPGVPFVIAGHNAHVAWGFTNLGADVQDLYIEHTRGTTSGAEFRAADGTWHPVRYHREIIRVRGNPDVTLDVPLVQHRGVDLPIISSIFPGETRTLSLRWTIYDPANVTAPFFDVNSASDWTTMLDAFSKFGGPAQNLMYADDQGHIGYHAVGRIPVRGDLLNPAPLAPEPTDAVAPDAATHEWAGYIPFDQLPQAFDPPDGVLATANARITLDGYRYPITLNWEAPYRTARIYKVLESTPGKPRQPRRQITPADMLALQTDIFSELDQIIAQRLAYAIDHTDGPLKDDKTLHQAADLMRNWDGKVEANAAAPAIVNAARAVFWRLLLVPQLAPQLAAQLAKTGDLGKNVPPAIAHDSLLWQAYLWGESETVEEQMLTDFPARWLPQGYARWEDFLAMVVKTGLRDEHAPSDLKNWQQGKAFPIDLEHPIFFGSPLLQGLVGVPTGTGPQPQNGDLTTIVKVARAFGPSERFTADLSDPDRTTLNIVLGESGELSSPWFMDQFPAWLHGTTYPLPFTPAAVHATTTHTVILTPR